MMKLLPSLRQKKRYVVFEIHSPKTFSFSEVKEEAENALRQFLGQLGMAKAGIMFVKEKYKNQRFILKVNHTMVDECKAGVMLIKKIKNIPVITRSVVVSGTLKKASSYLE